jgi:hypothetical protein
MNKNNYFQLKINSIDYNVFIRRKNFKRFSIRLNYKLEILVNCPISISNIKALEYLDNHKNWLFRAITKIETINYEYNVDLIKNQTKYLWFGLFYEVSFDDLLVSDYLFSEEKLLINPRSHAWNEKIANDSNEILQRQFDKFLLIVYPSLSIDQRITFKKMKTRWGSCNFRNKHISLNQALFHLPQYLINYVIIHELLHYTYPNHGKSFHAKLENFIPNHRLCEKEIKNYQFLLNID